MLIAPSVHGAQSTNTPNLALQAVKRPCGARASRLCEPRGHVHRARSVCERLLSCISAADMGLRALM